MHIIRRTGPKSPDSGNNLWLWRKHGDLFRFQFGKRTLIFAIHPEFVRQVNVTNRQNYDKLHSYDVARRYLIGRGLIASTGDLWRR